MDSEIKKCQSCKSQFTIEPEDFDFYRKIKVPPPTWCPDCRLQRRLAWRNERVLFRRTDSLTGKSLIAGFPQDVPFPVYERNYWWSDEWDVLQYGKNFNQSRPFLEQFRELMHAVPWASRSVMFEMNSEYTDQAGHLKNCYLCFNADYCENCSYLVRANTTKDTLDSLQIQNSELCYDSVLVNKSFRTFYSLDCDGSSDIYFSKQCVGCNHCFGCVGLRKKSYHIWNEPHSKEDYEKKLKEYNLGSRASIEALKAEAHRFWLKFPCKYYRGIRNINSSGDMLIDTKNARQCYWVTNAQDVRYCQDLYIQSSDCYDYTVWANHGTRIYECLTCGEEVQNLKFCFDCWPACRDLEYSVGCHSSSDCLGCVGLKKKQYCILNRQYSKEEYAALREKIIAHMNENPYVDKKGNVYRYGEFFPAEFSPFTYNETMLQDCFPLSREEALAKGYRWRDPERKEYQITLQAMQLSDHIEETSDDVIKEIIECAQCKRAYRIVAPELAFHKRLGLPLSDICPDCRHTKRFTFLNPPRFFERACMCAGAADATGVYGNAAAHSHSGQCANRFETSYAPDRQEIVYCEQCYQAEVA